MDSGNLYEQRGVSASKSEVHAAIKNLDKGLYPNAFCKILPDHFTGDESYCTIVHADTAGTKTALAYLYWKETGDISVWRGIVQDALVMNLDDMACAGMVDNFVISSTIGRNKRLVTGDVISEIINYSQTFMEKFSAMGIHMHLAGGETADVGDIVRTADIGFTIAGRMKREDVQQIKISAGDYIVGFSSFGQATYEDEYNGGMGSNGLTSARHDIFSSIYREKYSETYDPLTPKHLVYSGSRLVTENILIDGQNIPLGKLVLSPTRTYLPVFKEIFAECKGDLNGIIHSTGGGQTKVLHFVADGIRIVKDSLLPVPPLFEIIKEESKASWQEMYKVFNMGQRLEVYAPNIDTAEKLIGIGERFNIQTQIIGRVEKSEKGKEVLVVGPHGEEIIY